MSMLSLGRGRRQGAFGRENKSFLPTDPLVFKWHSMEG